MESIPSLGPQRKRHWVGFFLLVVYPPIKAERPVAGLTSFNRHENFEHILHYIAVAGRTKRFTFFFARLITCSILVPLYSVFVNGN